MFTALSFFEIICSFSSSDSLWKRLKDRVHLLSNGHQAELELTARLNHAAAALVPKEEERESITL
jgi:hypothetical protein